MRVNSSYALVGLGRLTTCSSLVRKKFYFSPPGGGGHSIESSRHLQLLDFDSCYTLEFEFNFDCFDVKKRTEINYENEDFDNSNIRVP